MKVSKNFIMVMLSVLVMTLIFANLVKVLAGTEQSITLNSLLNWLSNFNMSYQAPSLQSMIQQFTIQNEWLILDGLRLFINSLGSILGVVAYIVSNLIYCVVFASSIFIYILG